jgi:hypothetical protein
VTTAQPEPRWNAERRARSGFERAPRPQRLPPVTAAGVARIVTRRLSAFHLLSFFRVGWVERSETHRNKQMVGYAASRLTHPTLRIKQTPGANQKTRRGNGNVLSVAPAE